MSILDGVDGVENTSELKGAVGVGISAKVVHAEIGTHESAGMHEFLASGGAGFAVGVVVLVVARTLFALHFGEPVWVIAVEVGIGEFPELALLGRVMLERALLEMRHLVEAVHVELTDKRGEAIVLEEARKHLVTETDVVGYEEGGAVGRPADELVGVGIIHHASKLVEESRVVLVGRDGAQRVRG